METPVREALYHRIAELMQAGINVNNMDIFMSPDCHIHFCNESTVVAEEMGFDVDEWVRCKVEDILEGITFVICPKKD